MKPAHDEQQGAGKTLECYPNKLAPERVSTRFDEGGEPIEVS